MVDYLQAGIDKAVADALEPQAIRALGYDAVHTLCGKSKDEKGEIFVWESVREAIATRIAALIEIEAEDGTLITQGG